MIAQATSRRARRLLRRLESGEANQSRLLHEHLSTFAPTAFGAARRYGEISGARAFRERLPIERYEAFAPFIEREMCGEKNVLIPTTDPILSIGLSSGTTAASKHILITKSFFATYRMTWALWGALTFAEHLSAALGSILHITSNAVRERTESGIPVGNISGLLAETQPRYFKMRYLPSSSSLTGEAKIRRTLLDALQSADLSCILTASPLTLVTYAHYAQEHRHELLDALAAEGIATPRLQDLRALAQEREAFLPKNIWPDLQLLGVWLGGTLAHFVPEVRLYYGAIPARDHGYSATEGHFSVPIVDNTDIGVLNTLGTYFEFIDADTYDSSTPRLQSAHELKVGADYYVVISGKHGLTRYDMQDVIRCEGYLGTSPLIRFLQKSRDFINVAGEKVSAAQLARAVGDWQSQHSISLGRIAFVPRAAEQTWQYILLHENAQLTPAQEAKFAEEIDRFLQRANCEYAERRQSHRLLPLALQWDRNGLLMENQIDSMQRKGFSAEQFKHPLIYFAKSPTKI